MKIYYCQRSFFVQIDFEIGRSTSLEGILFHSVHIVFHLPISSKAYFGKKFGLNI